MGRQKALHTENSGFAYATLPWHISTFRGYRILFSIRDPYMFRCAPLVKKHTISITRGRSTGLPYQRVKEFISLKIYGNFMTNQYKS
jgi:hypothetical protein